MIYRDHKKVKFSHSYQTGNKYNLSSAKCSCFMYRNYYLWGLKSDFLQLASQIAIAVVNTGSLSTDVRRPWP